MLDVHAPNQTVHTWKDFLVHIAAITYRRLQLLNDASLAVRGGFTDARSIEIEEPDPAHLTPSQLEQQVTRTSVVLQRLITVANQQTNLARLFSGLSAIANARGGAADIP